LALSPHLPSLSDHAVTPLVIVEVIKEFSERTKTSVHDPDIQIVEWLVKGGNSVAAQGIRVQEGEGVEQNGPKMNILNENKIYYLYSTKFKQLNQMS
jgi:hypothetical protein